MDGTTPVGGQPKPQIDTTRYKDHLVTVKHNGKPITVTLEAALKGFMLQSDYSVKTEALAQAQAQVKSQQARYDKMDAFFTELESDPTAVVRRLQQHYEVGDPSATVGGNVDPDDEVAVMRAEMARLQAQVAQASSDSQAQIAERELQQQFPELDVADVRAYLESNNMAPDALVAGAKLLSFDQQAEALRLQQEADASHQATLDALNATKAGLPPITSGAAPSPGPDLVAESNEPKLLSWEEAANASRAELSTGIIDP